MAVQFPHQALRLANVHWRAAILVVIAAVACPRCVLRAGEVYKSVDTQGHAVYSDHPDMAAPQQAPEEIADSNPVADVELRATEAPPPLPDDEQPPCPEEGYLWTPGYWGWSAAGYYWIPGA